MRAKLSGRVLALALLLVADAGRVRAERYVLSPDASQVTFEVRHRHFEKPVRGRFRSFSGFIEVDPKATDGPRATAIEVRIDPASLDTGISLRDDHLRAGFFETARHPTILFRSNDSIGATASQLGGWLTLKDVRRRVTLELSALGPIVRSDGRRGVACRALAELDRRAYGVVEGGPTLPDTLLESVQRGLDALIEDRVVVRIRAVAWPAGAP